MILIPEEEIARLHILVDDIALMAVGQGGSTLEGDSAELVEVTIQVIV